MMRDRRLQQLLLRYRQNRDPKAIAGLFDAVAPELLAVARPVVGAGAEAEDLVQATFLVVLEHPERHDPECAVMPWLVGILTREARYWRRRSARRPDPERLGFEDDSSLGPREPQVLPMPESGARHAELKALLAKAMARVPSLYREVLSRHLHDGLDPMDIARELDRSAVTVRVQLHRGMARLRQLLPVGVTGGLALVLAPRGLAQVRSELLKHASGLTPATVVGSGLSLGTMTGWIFMAQKTTLAAMVAGLIALVFFMVGDDFEGAPSFEGRGELTLTRVVEGATHGALEATHSGDEDRVAVDRSDDMGGRNRVFSPLVVHVEWADGEVAPAVGLDLVAIVDGRFTGERRFVRTGVDGTVRCDDLQAESYVIYADRGRSVRVKLHAVAWGSDSGSGPDSDSGSRDEAAKELLDAMTTHATLVLARGHDVSGRVVDGDGKAVAGAVLWLTNPLTRERNREMGRADADGRFVLKQLAADCFLGAQFPGYAPSKIVGVERLLKVKGKSDDLEVELVLPGRGAEAAGLVIDAAGRPVVGARVRLGGQGDFDTYGPEGPLGPPPPLEVVTDDAGQFSAQGLAPGKIGVAVKADGYPIWAGHLKVKASAIGHLRVVLEQPAWVNGHVLFEDGVAAPGVGVRAMDMRRNGWGSLSSFGQPEARSDADGAFRLGPLSPGDVSLYAETALRKETAGMQFIAVAGGVYRWRLTLRGLPSIRGVAVDTQGKPLVGWSVVVRSEGPFGSPPVVRTTDADGAFGIPFQRDGRCRIELYAGGQFGRSAPLSWLDGVAAGSEGLRLVLDPQQVPNARIVGRLTSEFAIPRSVITVDHERFGRVAELELAAGKERFEVGRLPAGTVSLRVEPVGLASAWVTGLVLEGQRELRLESIALVQPGSFQVTAERGDGQVLENLSAELFDPEGRSCFVRREGPRLSRESLAPGRYRLQLSGTDCETRVFELLVEADEQIQRVCSLAVGAASGFVMLDAEGQLLGEAVDVKITGADGRTLLDRRIETSARGMTSFWERFPLGTHSIYAETRDGRKIRARFEVGRRRPLALRLR